MVQLNQQGVPLKKIAEIVKNEFERENLSYSTVYRVLQKGGLDGFSSEELDEAIKEDAHKSR